MPQLWGYSECNGPKCWGKNYPHALGQNQSPVDIIRAQVKPDPALLNNPLKFDYDKIETRNLCNGGFGWRVDIPNVHNISDLEGGPLKHRFRLAQFHSHWGETCCDGSEHTVDGETFSGELHLVHYNMDLYEDPVKAMGSEDGLAVIGIFLKEGKEHPEFRKICDVINQIKHKGDQTKTEEMFDIKKLLPRDTLNYWTYDGSLTTPPCFESVLWIVMKEPIELSKDQLDKFRSLLTYCEDAHDISAIDGPVLKNWRNCQPLETRVIREPGDPQ